MLCFKKNKIKMSLIEDYIQILFSKTFFDNEFLSISLSSNEHQLFIKTKKNVYFLNNAYESIFKKLKMNDISLLILKKEIKNNNNLFLQEKQNNFKTLSITINRINQELQRISNSLKDKSTLLKVN